MSEIEIIRSHDDLDKDDVKKIVELYSKLDSQIKRCEDASDLFFTAQNGLSSFLAEILGIVSKAAARRSDEAESLRRILRETNNEREELAKLLLEGRHTRAPENLK